MIYFTLPNFCEYPGANHFIATAAKTMPQVFKEAVTFIQMSGNFAYNYWAGSYCNMHGPGSYYKDFTAASQGGIILPIRLLADNIALEEMDFQNVMNKNILENANTSAVIEIASIPLMDYISERYTDFKYVFSKQADFITPFTADLVNQIIDFNKFQFIGVPDRLAKDFEFLEAIKGRNKLEITVNPRCPVKCRHYNECHINQHFSQLEFSATDNITLCRNNCLNKNIISLDDIKQDYIPRGINHFTFAQQNASIISENDMMAFYIFYFIKPEHQFAIMSQWLKFQEMQQQQRRMQ